LSPYVKSVESFGESKFRDMRHERSITKWQTKLFDRAFKGGGGGGGELSRSYKEVRITDKNI